MSFLTYETAKQGVDSQSRKMLKFCSENKISGCKLLVNVKTQNDVINVVIMSFRSRFPPSTTDIKGSRF